MSHTVNDSANAAIADRPPRHLFWPILLTSLISIHIVSVVVMVIVATHDSSFAIEPDWYQKGLHYEQTAQQQRENNRLGWSVQIEIGEPLSGTNRRNVSCTVLDRAGKPVEHAAVDLVAFAHLRASNRASSVLLPHGGGEYRGVLAFEDPGVWEFRLVITRGAETFTHIVKREI
jgi:nitrogen fixation protein FixH